MTQPHRKSDRTRLMLGCGGAALALAMAPAPQRAAAQGIQASPSLVSGSGTVTSPIDNTTQIDVFSQTAVIDWTPFLDNSGNALSFLPTGSTANFRGIAPNFAVLNRILPTTNNNIAVIDGSVLSQFGNPSSGLTTGGFIAFYSPTGILVGADARFDVGSLMLTTLDTSPTSFTNFADGGFLFLQGQQGSRATITVSPGAQIVATRENSFFTIVAADVEMRGTALVNGSHAYVAGELVDMRFSNGLFDILVSTGTAASGEVVTLNGTIGGPSSNGVGDNHMIYAVARASQDPISMLLSGNIGFEPAQSAGITNGEIILAANYNVSGRAVGGGTIGEDIDAVKFRRSNATTDVRGDITLQDFNASSSLLAISNWRTLATSINANSSVDGNLMLIGRQSAAIDVAGPRSFTVSGDVLVDARDFGVVGSGLQSLDVIDALGGTAQILARNPGAAVTIGGRAIVTAEAFAGQDLNSFTAGTARGGTAEIVITGGQVSINGNTNVRAGAFGDGSGFVRTGAEARGGIARFAVSGGGAATIGGDLDIVADAAGSEGDIDNPSTVSNAYGGQALLTLSGPNGTITVGGNLLLAANAVGGRSNNPGLGSVGDAGVATANVTGPGILDVGGQLSLLAAGVGGTNAGGTGGTGLGGRASIATLTGGTIRVRNVFNSDFGFFTSADGFGGNGQTGGDGFGGIAGADAIFGVIELATSAFASSYGYGGDANFGAGGNGGLGQGGYAFLQAQGTLTQSARLSIGANATVAVDGYGGRGGNGDDTEAGGRGGDGVGGRPTLVNQADPAFGGGAFHLAGGDNGTLQVAGESALFALGDAGRGGNGGDGSGTNGGRGGDGFGGYAQAGLALFGLNGSVGAGRVRFTGQLRILADGYAGDGGDANTPALNGDGGIGRGGDALLTVLAGNVNMGEGLLAADGYGGQGAAGGDGFGGVARVFGGLNGVLNANGLRISAQGFSSTALAGRGGSGFGGTAGLEIDGIFATIEGGDLIVDASGTGAASADGASGDGSGGTAYISSATGRGTLFVSGHTSVFANGLGADSSGDFAAGNGLGGLAFIDASNGSAMAFTTAQIGAVGRGGTASSHEGGDGTGGIVLLRSSGEDSFLSIDRNVSQAIAGESPAGDALLNADGIGGATFNGDGIGGAGRGGSVIVSAFGPVIIELPSNTLSDPDSVGAVRARANGIGGGSAAEGGIGGIGAGGSVGIDVEGQGSSLSIFDADFSVFSQGGSSLDASRNITGGAGIGGRRTIRVFNGGTLSLSSFGGQTRAIGGDGTGTGNGGIARGGRNAVEINGGTLNFNGILALLDEATGGTGLRGGDALASGEGGGVAFIANDATIIPNFGGQSTAIGITLDSIATGGAGASGGNAETSGVVFNLLNTNINAFTTSLFVRSAATGGNATDPAGTGGNAISGPIGVQLTNASLDFSEMLFASDANGGDGGGASGTGGNAQSGIVNVQMTGSAVTDSLNQSLMFEARSRATGGGGTIGGNGTSGQSTLALTNSVIAGGQSVSASASAFANRGGGGIAIAGAAGISLTGTGGITASDGTVLEANATAVEFTEAGAGSVSFRIESGSTAVVNAGFLDIRASGSSSANIFGTGPGNGFGQFAIDILGGSLNVQNLFAFVNGTGPFNRQTSRLVANGGNINVSISLRLRSALDIEVSTGSGSIIGNAVLTGNTAIIDLEAGGRILIVGDGSVGTGLFGQTFTIDAGNSILFGGNLTSRNGVVTLTSRPFGLPQTRGITMASGARIDAGTGTVTVRAADGTITLANIAAGRIDVRNLGLLAGSDITVRSGSVLTASGTGRAIDLASLGGEVINLAGDAGLVLTGGGHYGIFAATPTGSQIGSFANYARRYNVANAAAYDALNPGGNFAVFRIVPFLTVSAAPASRVYGNANPTFTASFAGFLPGDGIGGLTGTAQFTTLATSTSNIGQFAINAALGSLLSAQGYQFTFAPGVLNVTPRPLTVTANNLSRLYGNANPALIFAIGGLGLVNGDLLSGALATTAGTTTGVGNVAITQGTLAASANYALTFVNGQLTITPRLLTVSADNLSKLLGTRDPALTFVLSGDGLVNGDQLSGALVRDAGERIGELAIRQGTLGAGSNYAITFVNGQLTINAPPAPPGINNPTNLVPPIRIGDQPPPIVDEDEVRFGFDFPKSFEASLISEDPLLDDPVTSGGDASVYGDTAVPGGGGK